MTSGAKGNFSLDEPTPTPSVPANGSNKPAPLSPRQEKRDERAISIFSRIGCRRGTGERLACGYSR